MSPSYRSPTEVWHDFLTINPPLDASECSWLPTSTSKLAAQPVLALLQEWLNKRNERGVSEDRDQHSAFHRMLQVSLPASEASKDSNTPANNLNPLSVPGVGLVHHCIHTGYLAKLSSDFSLIPVGRARTAANCAFNIELQLSTLDPIHKQRGVAYNEQVMLANPTRFSAITAVTNLEVIMFIRTARVEEGGPLTTMHSIDFDVATAGWEILLEIIRKPEWTGQFLPDLTCLGQSVEIIQYLGAGVSSIVWSGQLVRQQTDNVAADHWSAQRIVCKTFKDRRLFDKELAVWTAINQRLALSAAAAQSATRLSLRESRTAEQQSQPPARSQSVPQPSVSSSPSVSSASTSNPHPPRHTLFFTPVGVADNDELTLAMVGDMFACLSALRQLRVVHRDLAPRHFLRCASEAEKNSASRGLFLIDLGYAVLLPEPDSADATRPFLTTFTGSTHFAPTAVLAGLVQAKKDSTPFQYTPLLAHDLESLVKVCYVKQWPRAKDELEAIDMYKVDDIHNYWVDLERRMASPKARAVWLDALKTAREGDDGDGDVVARTRAWIELDLID